MINITRNLTVRNSIVIGCGGLGGYVIGHLKNIIKDYFDLRTFDGVRFLAIDTALPEETVCPHVKNIGKDFYRIQVDQNNLMDILATPENYPKIYDSMPEIRELNIDDNIKQIPNLTDGCGTIRYLGRLAIRAGNNAQNIYNLLNSSTVCKKIQKSIDGSQVDFQVEAPLVFIVSSLFGGTGSGIFWDIAAIAKKAIPNSLNIGLFFLPTFHESRESGDRVKAGAYASLKEIEYYIRKNPIEWKYDIRDAQIIKISNSEFSDFIFQSIYLVDRPKGYDGKIERCKISEPVAEFLFYLSCSEIGKDFLNRQADLFGGATYLKYFPELDHSEKTGGVTKEQRIAFFSTFSIKSLEIPLEGLLNYAKRKFSYDMGRKMVSPDIPADIDEEKILRGSLGQAGLLTSLKINEADFDNLFKKSARIISRTPGGENPLTYLIRQLDNIPAIVKEWDESFKNVLEEKRKYYLSEQLKPGKILEEIREIINRYSIEMGRRVCNALYSELNNIKINKERMSTQLQQNHNENALDGFIKKQRQFLFELQQDYQKRISGLADRVALMITRRYPISEEMRTNIEAFADEVNCFVENFQTLLRNKYIVSFIESIEGELSRIKDKEIPLIQNNLDTIYGTLKEKMKKEILNIRKSSLTRETVEIDDLEGKFYKRMLEIFSKEDHPENLVNQIKNKGFDLTGQKKGVAFLIDEIEDNTERMFKKYSEVINERIMKIDFDSNFISYHPEEPPDDVGHLKDQISKISPLLNFSAPPSANKYFLFSGSMIDNTNPKNWQKELEKHFPALQISKGRYSNQVTLINFYLGIPLVSIPDLKDWYNEYIKKIEKKFPVHVLKSCVYMPESWFDPNYSPDRFIEQLFQCLVEHNILEEGKTGEYRYSLGKRTEYSGLFIDSRTNTKKFLAAEKFKQELGRNYILHHDLKEKLIRQIINKGKTNEIVIDEYINDLRQKGNDWIDFANMLLKEIRERLAYS